MKKFATKQFLHQKGKKAIYNRLVESELFEQYLDKKFLGTKRYGIEGGESMIPGIEQIVKQACIAESRKCFYRNCTSRKIDIIIYSFGNAV